MYKDEVDHSISVFASILEPLLLFVMGLFVALIVWAVTCLILCCLVFCEHKGTWHVAKLTPRYSVPVRVALRIPICGLGHRP